MFPFHPPFIGYPFNNYYNYRRNNYFSYPVQYPQSDFATDTSTPSSINMSNKASKNIPLKSNTNNQKSEAKPEQKKDSSPEPFNDYFFEIFGLKLYFDDILLICLIFFLYEEGVKDQELFISLILLLLS